ncbi:MAG: LLM class flavin-dependent oxidoreductase [Chloroflexota bacterium]|nr:LLM class flavin-dependent oxidoreductase [Chloroflexota bacterium]
MRPLKVGLVLPMLEDPPTGEKIPWATIRGQALLAEEMGFDTVLIPDELLWRPANWPAPRGFWECVSMTAAVAAATSRIEIGTWVLSALHRNPGLTAKIAETIDEISGGRFLLGLGSGHAGKQGEAFGYPLDRTIGRYEEALQIIVPLLREGRADFHGEFHTAVDLLARPRGPRPGQITIMLGAHGPRTMRLAARHADIWSAYATESSLPAAFEPMLKALDEACADVGRDPASLGRSIGVVVEPTDDSGAEAADMGIPIRGTPTEIADTFKVFAGMGVTRLEVLLWPDTGPVVQALAPVLAALDG